MTRWIWHVALTLWLTLTLWLMPVSAAYAAATEPRVELYTMGPGDDPFSLFGHAALCVFDVKTPRGRCYNYGTTDFSRPAALTLDFLRGQARFWVSVSSASTMVDAYRRRDRAVYRQVLPLTPERARAFAAALDRDLDRTSYRYHHFDDNCATRLRDHIDTFTDGRLKRGADVAYEASLRQVVREGLATYPGLLVISELVLGRRVDPAPTLWEAMFLPRVLREQVRIRLGAEPEPVSPRLAAVSRGQPLAGLFWIAWLGSLFGWSCGLMHASRKRWLRRLGALSGGVGFGGVGLLLVAVAVISPLRDLRANEMLVVLTPLDFMTTFVGGSTLKLFVRLRIVGLAAVLLGSAAGVFIQPLAAPICAVLVWQVCLALSLRTAAG